MFITYKRHSPSFDFSKLNSCWQRQLSPSGDDVNQSVFSDNHAIIYYHRMTRYIKKIYSDTNHIGGPRDENLWPTTLMRHPLLFYSNNKHRLHFFRTTPSYYLSSPICYCLITSWLAKGRFYVHRKQTASIQSSLFNRWQVLRYTLTVRSANQEIPPTWYWTQTFIIVVTTLSHIQ